MDKIVYTGTNYDEVKRLCGIVATVSQQSPRIVFRQNFNLSRLFCVFASTLKHDFLVDDRYLFEVGGPKKSFNQIKDVENSFLAIDGVEFGRGNKIPLWLFGFLY